MVVAFYCMLPTVEVCLSCLNLKCSLLLAHNLWDKDAVWYSVPGVAELTAVGNLKSCASLFLWVCEFGSMLTLQEGMFREFFCP